MIFNTYDVWCLFLVAALNLLWVVPCVLGLISFLIGFIFRAEFPNIGVLSVKLFVKAFNKILGLEIKVPEKDIGNELVFGTLISLVVITFLGVQAIENDLSGLFLTVFAGFVAPIILRRLVDIVKKIKGVKKCKNLKRD